MKFKKMMLVTLLLLAILTLGAVSASDGADALTADDSPAEEVALEETSAADENIVNSQESVASDDLVGDGEPISFEDVNFDVRIDEYATDGSDGKSDWAFCVINVPQGVNGTIVVSSGDEVFFNKSLGDYDDPNFYWDTGEGSYDYAIAPSDVNFFSGLKTGDIVKFSLFDGDNLVGSHLSKITFENNFFRLESTFNIWVWNDDDLLGPLYLDTLHSVVNIDVWGQEIDGIFYVSCNGKEYKYKAVFDESGNSWHNWALSSFGITEPGSYPVTIRYGTEDGPEYVVGQKTLHVHEFDYTTFRGVLINNNHLLSLYCPDGAQGTITIFVRCHGESDDYPADPVVVRNITSDDYNKWIDWSFDELGCQIDNGYNFCVKIDGADVFDDGCWYGQYWPRDFVPDDVFIEINQGDLRGDDWVLNLYVPESSSFTEGNLTIKSGTVNMIVGNYKELKYWEMDMDTEYRLYQYQLNFNDLKNLAKLKDKEMITFTFTYLDNGTQKEYKRIAFFERKDDSIRFNSFVYVRDDYESCGPVYLDSPERVVSIDVWTPGITGTFHVFCNGKEFRFKVNYAEDENGGNRQYTLKAFGITETGIYPVTVTYGTEDDPGDLIMQDVIIVREFNYDTFRAITYQNECFIALYCPENADGTISIFLKKEDVDDYPSKPAVTHVINSSDYGNWLNWTYKELGAKLQNGYNMRIEINDGNDEKFSYEDFIWYERYEPREFVPTEISIIPSFELFFLDEDNYDRTFMELYIPESALVYGGNLTIKSGTRTLFSKKLTHWNMNFDNENRLYFYEVLFGNLKNVYEMKDGEILRYAFAYDDNGTRKIIEKSIVLRLVDDEDGERFEFSFARACDANLLDDDVILMISDFPEGIDDEFKISTGIWDRYLETTWKISELTRNEDGVYAFKASDFNFKIYDFYPDADYNLFITFYKDGVKDQEYEFDGWIYKNPALPSGEITLDPEENYIVLFVKRPESNIQVSIKRGGASTNINLPLQWINSYYLEDEEWYAYGIDCGDFNWIDRNGEYEITASFTIDGVEKSYTSTFSVYDFTIDVRYGDDDPWNKTAIDLRDPIFKVNLPENSSGRIVVDVNGAERMNMTLDEKGYTYWNRMGAYYVTLGDLQIAESGTYGLTLKIYDDEGNLRRSVSTNLDVIVSYNYFFFNDGIYSVSENPDLFDFHLGAPIPKGTIVTLYINDEIVANGIIGAGLDLDPGCPGFDIFHDEFGSFKPGYYDARVVYTYRNGTNETVAESSFSVLTKSGNVNITLSSENALTVDKIYVEVSALEPASYSDKFVLKISIDPDEDEGRELYYDANYLSENVWNVATKKFNLGTLSAGTHLIMVTYFADDRNNMVSTDFFSDRFTVTVKKTSTILAASSIVTFYQVSKKLLVTLKDANGKAISGKKVTIKVGTISKTLTTNSKGQVAVDICKLIPKAYFAYINFAGDNTYLKAPAKKVTVKVNKAPPKILAPIKGYKLNVKVKTVTATLKDNKGKIIKNAKLTLKINGKSYIARTDAKGIATFKVTNLNKRAKFVGLINFAGDKYFKPLNGRVTVVVK
ncbi:hypothetical protein [uncultured Methanobrevibacter sp.]|uniref:hypothetical protein n=1 Tax=uncultured Methanobrevibacter sp. TaxID=253161 RepID=UPI002639E00D|nr:hypothetical protein [uncultured Methanobrevibacter sp.]